MKIGIPKEIKNHEYRVALTPAATRTLIKDGGHIVYVQKNAGVGSSFSDKEYEDAGAIILETAEEVFAQSKMIIKVKEPLAEEIPLIKEGHILFTYLHLASSKTLTDALIKTGATCIAYETIKLPDGSLPLLQPMSEIAGRMSVQVGAEYLEKMNGGRGVLLGGVPGVPPADVVILGGGTTGKHAAKIALGMGANVTILDINLETLRHLEDILSGRLETLSSNYETIERAVKYADLLIGAVLIPGAKAPTLVTEAMVKEMKSGSVIVDISVDQGGCIETTHATTHSAPVYEKHGVIHYGVANMPGAVPRTSTFALVNATLPYAQAIATFGYQEAMERRPELKLGLNIDKGEIIHPEVEKWYSSL